MRGVKPYQPLAIGASPKALRGASQDKLIQEAEKQFGDAAIAASTLLADLEAHPTLRVIVAKLEGRINEMLLEDPFCKSMLEIIATFRQVVEVAPEVARRRVIMLLGPTLTAALNE